MDAAVGKALKPRWLILIYQLPRYPSRHRVAVWRKLRSLGALYLQDGVAALPEDAVTREQLEWLQLRVREAGGKATLWEGLPNTVAESKSLVEAFRAAREEGYLKVTEGAERILRKAELGGNRAPLLEELTRTEREFRAERRRDDCSFETFLEEYSLEDPVLVKISEIVHDADLMDAKYGRPESDGLDAIIRGMQLVLPEDPTLTRHTDAIFDGLYAYLSREVL